MNNNSLISIVLPVYNGEQYLSTSIESVLNQTYQNWELLLVDDCSTDNTSSICMQYASMDHRIKYIHNEKNLRLPGNLNKGFSLTNGYYLTWTSDDNAYKSDALEKMHEALVNCPNAGLVYCSYQIVDENMSPISIIHADKDGINHITGSNIVGACFMYTRDAYDIVGDYNEDLLYVEDFDYWQRMMSKVDSVALDEILYFYRWHPNSLTSIKKQEDYGKRIESMLIKNRILYEPMNLEQKRFFYSCLNKGIKAQGKRSLIFLKAFFYEQMGRFVAKLKRVWG